MIELAADALQVANFAELGQHLLDLLFAIANTSYVGAALQPDDRLRIFSTMLALTDKMEVSMLSPSTLHLIPVPDVACSGLVCLQSLGSASVNISLAASCSALSVKCKLSPYESAR